jgi:hypothetical protein
VSDISRSSERPLIERGLKMSNTVPTTVRKLEIALAVASAWTSSECLLEDLGVELVNPDLPSSVVLCGREVMRASLFGGSFQKQQI